MLRVNVSMLSSANLIAIDSNFDLRKLEPTYMFDFQSNALNLVIVI